MQINSNNQQNKQNFGMAFHSNANVNNALKTRIKKPSDWNKFNKIIDSQAKNDKMDIDLLIMPDGKSICAKVHSTSNDVRNYKFHQYEENFFTKLFNGPVGFLEKCAKVADKDAENIINTNLKIDKILNKIG